MDLFVEKNSIVRKIWGKSDTVLFIFAGAAAEFALNKAVDWLYFTGKLPSDPLGRLFSTVRYARLIIFSSQDEAHKSIDTLQQIHSKVEQNRGTSIPDWAYRDVLFMLIYYSITSYELLERKLTDEEKEEVYNVFLRVGTRMGLSKLPLNYESWLPIREMNLNENLRATNFTLDLFKQYRKHLGLFRYGILIESQKKLVPNQVKVLLRFSSFSLLMIVIPFYKISKSIKLDKPFKNILLPSEYKNQINELDIAIV
jgi:hypothetical protein